MNKIEKESVGTAEVPKNAMFNLIISNVAALGGWNVVSIPQKSQPLQALFVPERRSWQHWRPAIPTAESWAATGGIHVGDYG